MVARASPRVGRYGNAVRAWKHGQGWRFRARGDRVHIQMLQGKPGPVGHRPALLTAAGLFLLSTFVLLGILGWLPYPALTQRNILSGSGALAIAGWSVLAIQLIRSWALSEQRTRTAFEQAMAGVGLIDEQARWIDANARMAELTGYSVAELRGMPLYELLIPEELDATYKRMLAFLGDDAGPSEYSIESRWRRKDGTLVWLSRHIRRVPAVRGMRAHAMMMVFDISDRKLAEERASEQQSVENFQFVHSPMALIEWGPEMRVRRWSKQAEVLFGWSAEEIIGRTLREAGFLPEDEADHHENVMSEFVQGKRDSVESLRRVRCKDGRFAWCRWFSRAMRSSDGSLQYFFSAGIDVTELREALDAVQEKEGQLRAIFDQATVGVALLDELGRWLSVNHRLCEITGYSQDELLRLDFQTITHPDDLRGDEELAGQVARGERRSYVLEKRYLHKQGQVVWIRLHVGRIDPTGNTPMRYVSVIEDISERKRMEDEAEEHRRIREFHVENTPLGVVAWTPDLRVAYWSGRAEKMFGWSAAEVLGKQSDEFDFIHPEDRSVLDRWSRQVQVEHQTFTTSIHRNRHKDGHAVWCHWYNSMLYAPDGSVRSVYCLVDDVTEEQSAIAQLKDSQVRFRSIFEQAAVGIALIDADSHWLMVNPRFCEITGYDPQTLQQRTCLSITDPEDRASEIDLRARLIAGDITHYNLEKRYLRADGSTVWVSLFARRLELADGEPVRLALVVDDITDRIESARKLTQMHAELEGKVEERTQQLQDTTRRWADRTRDLSVLGEMMSSLPAAQNLGEAHQIIAGFLPRVFREYSGEVWIEASAHGRFVHLIHWNLPAAGPAIISADDCWALRRGQALHVEDPRDPLVCPHGHDERGHQAPHACMPIMALGEIIGLIYLRWTPETEVTPDRALLESAAEQVGLAIGNVCLREELRRQALRDSLTGLFNRRHFEEILRRRLTAHQRDQRGFSLLMIDIDHFKSINDQCGHEAGDQVLRAVAGALQKSSRSDDAVFRLGGEEFVVLLDDPEGLGSNATAERIRELIERLPISFQGVRLPSVTVSIGAAHLPTDANDADSLIRRADQAMYDAKRTGRNRVCFAGTLSEHAPRLAVVDGRTVDRIVRPDARSG